MLQFSALIQVYLLIEIYVIDPRPPHATGMQATVATLKNTKFSIRHLEDDIKKTTLSIRHLENDI
jgi:hypothetical protein